MINIRMKNIYTWTMRLCVGVCPNRERKALKDGGQGLFFGGG